MIHKVIILIALALFSCTSEAPTQFSEKALHEKIVSTTETLVTFKEVLNTHKGKKIMIDFWASWCKDCLEGLPKVKQLQEEFPEVVFVFLSVDKKTDSWKYAINKHNIKGEHFNLPKGMSDGELVNFIGLDWIPRYLVVDENGRIVLFKAIDTSDKKIKEALNQ